MTQQEQQLLNGLIDRVNKTQLAGKDSEAENLLNSALRNNPDALYILCQTVLVQQFAMDNAQRQLTAARAELDQLKQQAGKSQEHGSFLGNLFGLGKSDEPAAPATTGSANQPTGYAPVHNPSPYGYTQQPPPAPGYGGAYPGGYAQPGYAPGMGYGAPVGGGMFGGGGFLQGAMQTAAGVVAGEFAFRAIEDVFHGFGGGGRGFEGGNTEVVNNYYDTDSGAHDGSSFGDRLAAADGGTGGGLSPDIEDRRGDARGFMGDNSGGDQSAFADANDNSGFADDNSGGYDDGGSYGDDGGGYSDDSGSNDGGF